MVEPQFIQAWTALAVVVTVLRYERPTSCVAAQILCAIPAWILA